LCVEDEFVMCKYDVQYEVQYDVQYDVQYEVQYGLINVYSILHSKNCVYLCAYDLTSYCLCDTPNQGINK